MKLRPLFNNVLLKPIKAGEQKLASGLVVPETIKEQGAWLAEVVAVGPGVYADGYFREPPKEIKPGVKVYVPAFPGYQTRLDNQDYLQVKDTEILSVLE